MNEKCKKIFFFISGFVLFPIVWICRRFFHSNRESMERVEQLNKRARETVESAGSTITESMDSTTRTAEVVEQCKDTNSRIRQTTKRARELLEEIKNQPLKN